MAPPVSSTGLIGAASSSSSSWPITVDQLLFDQVSSGLVECEVFPIFSGFGFIYKSSEMISVSE